MAVDIFLIEQSMNISEMAAKLHNTYDTIFR